MIQQVKKYHGTKTFQIAINNKTIYYTQQKLYILNKIKYLQFY